jgi:hypothetical protein
MTTDKFISQTEGYYNLKYNKIQKDINKQWLNKQNERYLDFIFSEVLKLVSSSFKSLPGIHEFDKALKIVKKERWAEVTPHTVPEYPDADTKANKKVVEDLFKGLKAKIFVKPVKKGKDIF